ncbi:hypothetical protein K488DRAFT_88849 [Vararia minispora EC-137]|uniref:Uncharacterized protein n=1 Tax=Vararia minispora EC-137 TaxID=1314806 RepID=A0ACB8QCB6_9AGAM|nr:hypothetical protein K488DRAFT_88849 [Vararia minispora EC-137]
MPLSSLPMESLVVGCTFILLILLILVSFCAHWIVARRRRMAVLLANESFGCRGMTPSPVSKLRSLADATEESSEVSRLKTPSSSHTSIRLTADRPVVINLLSEAAGCVNMRLVLTPPTPLKPRRWGV